MTDQIEEGCDDRGTIARNAGIHINNLSEANMDMDFVGEKDKECFWAVYWDECLDRAREFGWEPEGTFAPIYRDENGSHCGNSFQWVSDRDARALGEALLRAVAALSARANVPDPFQAKTREIRGLRRLADFALKGGFVTVKVSDYDVQFEALPLDERALRNVIRGAFRLLPRLYQAAGFHLPHLTASLETKPPVRDSNDCP